MYHMLEISAMHFQGTSCHLLSDCTGFEASNRMSCCLVTAYAITEVLHLLVYGSRLCRYLFRAAAVTSSDES